MASCSSVFGFMLVIAAVVACAVSFATPFWVQNKDTDSHLGLWQSCQSNGSCSALNGDKVEAWFNVVRSLYALAVLLLVIDLFYAICYFTCICCHAYTAVQLLALDLLLVLLASVIALLTFTIKSNDSPSLPVHFDHGNLRFAWSYYVGIGSVAATLAALVFYICEIPKARRVAAYEPIIPTSAS